MVDCGHVMINDDSVAQIAYLRNEVERPSTLMNHYSRAFAV